MQVPLVSNSVEDTVTLDRTHPGPLLQGGAQIRTTGIIEETCRYPPPEMLEEIKACTTIQVSHSHTYWITVIRNSEIPRKTTWYTQYAPISIYACNIWVTWALLRRTCHLRPNHLRPKLGFFRIQFLLRVVPRLGLANPQISGRGQWSHSLPRFLFP